MYSYLLSVAIYSVDFFRKRLGTDNLHLCMYPFFFLSSSIVPSPPRFFFIYSNVFCLCGSKNSPLLPVSFEIHYSPCSLFSLSLSLFVFLYSIDNRKLFSSYHHFSWDSSPISQVDTIGWERERETCICLFEKENRYVVYIYGTLRVVEYFHVQLDSL